MTKEILTVNIESGRYTAAASTRIREKERLIGRCQELEGDSQNGTGF